MASFSGFSSNNEQIKCSSDEDVNYNEDSDCDEDFESDEDFDSDEDYDTETSDANHDKVGTSSKDVWKVIENNSFVKQNFFSKTFREGIQNINLRK